jgi:hypothetical protein
LRRRDMQPISSTFSPLMEGAVEVPGRWWQKPHRLPESSDEACTGEAYVKHKYIMDACHNYRDC